jgi:hypothetical protein
MEIWVPLISACIGGLIATIPILIGLAVQMYLHISESQQKKREAKIQLVTELTKSDIKIIEASIDNQLKGFAEITRIVTQHRINDSSDEELLLDIRARFAADDGKFWKLFETDRVSYKLAHALGDEFYSEYRGYVHKFTDCASLLISSTSEPEGIEKMILEMYDAAGKLHTLMNERLISLRDT